MAQRSSFVDNISFAIWGKHVSILYSRLRGLRLALYSLPKRERVGTNLLCHLRLTANYCWGNVPTAASLRFESLDVFRCRMECTRWE